MIPKDRILKYLPTCGMTIAEALTYIKEQQAVHPNHTVIIDGDLQAIVARGIAV